MMKPKKARLTAAKPTATNLRGRTRGKGLAAVALSVSFSMIGPMVGASVAGAEVPGNPRVTDVCLHSAGTTGSTSADAAALQEAGSIVSVASSDLGGLEEEAQALVSQFEEGSTAARYADELSDEIVAQPAADAADALGDLAALVDSGADVSVEAISALDVASNQIDSSIDKLSIEMEDVASVLSDELLVNPERANAEAAQSLMTKSLAVLKGSSDRLASARAVAMPYLSDSAAASYVRPIAAKRSSSSVMADTAKSLRSDAAAVGEAAEASNALSADLSSAVAALDAGDPLRSQAESLSKILLSDGRALQSVDAVPDGDAASIAAAHPLGRPSVQSTLGLASLDRSILRMEAMQRDLDAFAEMLTGTETTPAQADLSAATSAAKSAALVRSASLSSLRSALVAQIAPKALALYKPAASIDRSSFEPASAAAVREIASVGKSIAAQKSAVAAHSATLLKVAGSMDAAKVDHAVAAAAAGAIKDGAAALGAAEASLASAGESLASGGRVSAAATKGIDQQRANLASVRDGVVAAQAELAAQVSGENAEALASRAAAAKELSAAAGSLDAAIVAVDKGVAVMVKQMSSADRLARTPVAAKVSMKLPHAGNAAAMASATEGLSVGAAGTEAAAIASIAAAKVSPELQAALTDAASASSTLQGSLSATAKTGAAVRATIAAGGRVGANAAALEQATAQVAGSTTDLAAAKARLSGLKLAEADAAVRDSALASIARIEAASTARASAVASMKAVAAKYTYVAVKRVAVKAATPTPVAKEPVVKEPVVAEPVVKEPVVKEPVVAEPVVKEPVVKEPVVAEPVVKEPAVKEPVAKEPAVIDGPAEPETNVLGVTSELLAASHSVIEGETLVIPLAELGDGEIDLEVAIDALTEHGVVTMVRTATGCELHFASVAGCIGTDTVEVTVVVDGNTEVIDLEIDIVADTTTTTTTTTTVPTTTTTTAPSVGQRPNQLAFSGVTTSILGAVGGSLVVFGFGMVRVSRRNEDGDFGELSGSTEDALG